MSADCRVISSSAASRWPGENGIRRRRRAGLVGKWSHRATWYFTNKVLAPSVLHASNSNTMSVGCANSGVPPPRQRLDGQPDLIGPSRPPGRDMWTCEPPSARSGRKPRVRSSCGKRGRRRAGEFQHFRDRLGGIAFGRARHRDTKMPPAVCARMASRETR